MSSVIASCWKTPIRVVGSPTERLDLRLVGRVEEEQPAQVVDVLRLAEGPRDQFARSADASMKPGWPANASDCSSAVSAGGSSPVRRTTSPNRSGATARPRNVFPSGPDAQAESSKARRRALVWRFMGAHGRAEGGGNRGSHADRRESSTRLAAASAANRSSRCNGAPGPMASARHREDRERPPRLDRLARPGPLHPRRSRPLRTRPRALCSWP